MNLRSKVEAFFLSLLPRARVTRFDTRTLPSEVVSALDVDRVAEILTAAQHGNCAELFGLYRDIVLTDAHLQGRLSERKEAVLGDTLNIQPKNKRLPEDVATAQAMQEAIGDLATWEDALVHLLDSTLYPVAVVEKVFRRSEKPGLRYELAELVPVPHDLLDFRMGRLQIRETDAEGRPLAGVFEPDPRRYIVHRAHLLTTPDNWGGPMRALVFWWLLGTMSREWWGRFLDRYGAPFLVGKFDQADDASRTILERAFSYCTKIGGLVVSRQTDVEIKQAAASDTGAAYEKFIDVCNREKSKLILGDSLGSDAQPTGLGSGVAKSQEAKRTDKRASDARRLGATLRGQLFRQLLEINGLKGQAPLAIWGAVTPEEMQSTAAVLESLATAGLQVGDTGLEVLSERMGLPIERAPAPVAPAMPGASGVAPMSVGALRLHATHPMAIRAQQANEAIMRTAAVKLVPAMQRAHGRAAEIVLHSASPEEALGRLEAYFATLPAVEAAELFEEAFAAYAANGAAGAAR